MFGKSFITQQLAPATMGNPAVIADPAMLVTRVLARDPAAWNSAFATIQLALAAGLLWRRTAKAALAGTVVWALSVWWFGEGLGSVLTGTATPLTGAPGAAVLYALIAVLAWPASRAADSRTCIAAASPPGIRWARASWLVLWGSFAYLVLQAPERAPRGLHDTLAGLAAGQPGWLAAIDRSAAAAAGSRGTILSVGLAAVFLLIAAGIFHPATTRTALLLAAVTARAIWVAGENFGGILTGQGTDPDTGPLLILLATAFWPLAAAGTGPRLTRKARQPEPVIMRQAPQPVLKELALFFHNGLWFLVRVPSGGRSVQVAVLRGVPLRRDGLGGRREAEFTRHVTG